MDTEMGFVMAALGRVRSGWSEVAWRGAGWEGGRMWRLGGGRSAPKFRRSPRPSTPPPTHSPPAQVHRGSLVLDPFVGTGSCLIPAAHWGALTLGADIDARVIKLGERAALGGSLQGACLWHEGRA